MFGDFGPSKAHWRQGLVPTPSSQCTTLELLDKLGDDFEESSSESDTTGPPYF